MSFPLAPISISIGRETHIVDPDDTHPTFVAISKDVIELETQAINDVLEKSFKLFANTIAKKTGAMKEKVMKILRQQVTPVLSTYMVVGFTAEYSIQLHEFLRDPKIRFHLATPGKRVYKKVTTPGTKPMDFKDFLLLFEEIIIQKVFTLFTSQGYTITPGGSA